MGKVKSLNEAREEKTLYEMRQFIDEVMSQADPEKPLPDDELDKKLDRLTEKWNQCKGGAEMERLYTPDQVAEYLQIAPKTIRDYLRDGKIKGIKVGKEWRVKESALQAYVDRIDDTGKKPLYTARIRHRSDGTWTGKITSHPKDLIRQPGERPAEIETLHVVGPKKTRKEVEKELHEAFEQMKSDSSGKNKIEQDEKLFFLTTGGGRPERQHS